MIHPFGLHSTGTTQDIVSNAPYLGVEGLKAVAAMVTILLVIYAVANKSLRRLMTPIALLVTLTVSLQILVWIDSLFGKTTDTTGRVALFAAVVLVVALLWELAASGEGVTNLHSKWFPRDARVMLFAGYILLVSSAVLFYSSLHDAKSQTLLESQFDSEEFVRSGIFFLGVPLVTTLCLIGMHRWRESQRQEPVDPVPNRPIRHRRLSISRSAPIDPGLNRHRPGRSGSTRPRTQPVAQRTAWPRLPQSCRWSGPAEGRCLTDIGRGSDQLHPSAARARAMTCHRRPPQLNPATLRP